MWQKISALPIMAYLAFSGLVQDLKKDERGLSGVVVAVLLILVAVLAVILIWSLLGEQIETWWSEITDRASELE